MLTNSVLPADINAIQQYFATLADVIAVYLFGSYARGVAGPLSDVDIAVLLKGHPDEEYCLEVRLELIGGLTNRLHMDEVDVVILNQAPPALCYAVLRDGRLLFCRDSTALALFRLQSVNAYLDFKPLLERHGHAILEKARKGELLHGPNPYRETLERYRQVRERLAFSTPSDV